VITSKDDRWNSGRAQRLFRLGLVGQVGVSRVEPGGHEAEKDNPLGR
jgi:hypothetical protein